MKLQQSTNQKRADQFFIGLPISVVKAMEWKKGDEIEVKVLGIAELKLRKVST